jgi:hypothetical protein
MAQPQQCGRDLASPLQNRIGVRDGCAVLNASCGGRSACDSEPPFVRCRTEALNKLPHDLIEGSVYQMLAKIIATTRASLRFILQSRPAECYC